VLSFASIIKALIISFNADIVIRLNIVSLLILWRSVLKTQKDEKNADVGVENEEKRYFCGLDISTSIIGVC